MKNFKRVPPPKYRVGRYVLNEYEIRSLILERFKEGRELSFKCLVNNTKHNLGREGKLDLVPESFSLMSSFTLGLIKLKREKAK